MSPVVLIIFIGIPLLSLAWFAWADRRLKNLRSPKAVRCGLWAALLLIIGTFIWVILARQGTVAASVPPVLYSTILLWALVFLPFVALPMMTGWSVLTIFRRIVTPKKSPPGTLTTDPGRRQFIGSAAVTLPVVATFGATAFSVSQRNHFRIREITLPIPNLPPALDGIRIVHLSDTHVGKFTRGKLLNTITEATNRLKADLILHTGDLIDQSIDDLPEALDMLARLDSRFGLYLIEGNHDLFQGPEKFGKGVLDRGFNLLRDESATVRVNGHPIDLLGIRWNNRGTEIEPHVDAVNQKRDPDAFPILLAHHPHAFDRAASLGIPLTLAGHTHGGQLMVTPEIGAGPLFFKYWSGLYQKPNSSLIVSNGAGNWFPVRTSAPAEIIHLTLKRA